MKRVFFLIAAFAMTLAASAANFADETLRYVIFYKWGLIQKDSGDAVLKLNSQGDTYSIELAGSTKPWADKFYVVRDTLRATVRKQGFRPLSYERIAHEGGKYAHDLLTYYYEGRNVNAKVSKYRDKKGEISTSEAAMTAQGAAYDMLTVFYYLRTIDYANLASNRRLKTVMFSGSKKETLTLQCLGKEKVKLRGDKAAREAWHIRFNFTSAGGKKSSDDLDAWISADAARIPLLVEGSLPIGKVKAMLVE